MVVVVEAIVALMVAEEAVSDTGLDTVCEDVEDAVELPEGIVEFAGRVGKADTVPVEDAARDD